MKSLSPSRHVQWSLMSLWRMGFVLLACLLVPPVLHAGDGLFAFYINFNTGQLEIREYDPANGQFIGLHVFVDTGGMQSPIGLAWHQNRFVTLVPALAGTRGLVEIHPSTGVGALVGGSGIPFNTPILEANPTTGGLLYLNNEFFNLSRLYRVDPLTGAATPGPFLHGATTYLNSFAIGSNGRGYGTSNLDLFSLDPASGATIALGPINIGNGVGACIDLSLSSQGELVGLFLAPLPPYSASGLYRIDPQTLIATPLVLMPGHGLPALGVAFAPDLAGTTYCQGKANSLSCTPWIAAHGFPSVTASGGFQIACNDVRSQTPGLLMYGSGGPASIPFQGGLLCIGGAMRRTPMLNSHGSPPGTPTCSGVWTIDFNAHLFHLNPQSALAGTTIYSQWFGRDPGYAAPNNSTLSDALQFTLIP